MDEFIDLKNLMEQIEAIVVEEQATRVLKVCVRLGPLSHLDHEHFLQRFRLLAHGTAAQEAEVETVITNDLSNPDAHRVLLETIEVD
mgnify:CR=1 FL=1|jgi:Zn finger protein HypA/HybF involved in hydrogenase expression